MPKVTILLLLLSTILMVGCAQDAQAGLYLNSTETGCDGSDATVVFCDNFSDGELARTDADCYQHTLGTSTKTQVEACLSAGGASKYSLNQGWFVSIYTGNDSSCSGDHCTFPSSQDDPWYARCSTSPVTPPVGADCYARSGISSGGETGVLSPMSHNPGPTTDTQYDELWVRFYVRFTTGMTWTDTKIYSLMHTFDNNGIIEMGHFGCNKGSGSFNTDCFPVWCPSDGSACLDQNETGGAGFTQSGHWWVFQAHHIMNTTSNSTNCTVDLYLDDCGTDGACSGSPTRRMHYTNAKCWRTTECPTCTSGDHGIGSMDFEVAYQNAPNWSAGEEWFLTNIKASTSGPIAFAGAVGGGSSGTMALFLRGLALFHLGGTGFFLWQRRAAALNALWATYEAGHEIYWMWKWKRAVRRWQASAPLMLPPPTESMTVQPKESAPWQLPL